MPCRVHDRAIGAARDRSRRHQAGAERVTRERFHVETRRRRRLLYRDARRACPRDGRNSTVPIHRTKQRAFRDARCFPPSAQCSCRTGFRTCAAWNSNLAAGAFLVGLERRSVTVIPSSPTSTSPISSATSSDLRNAPLKPISNSARSRRPTRSVRIVASCALARFPSRDGCPS